MADTPTSAARPMLPEYEDIAEVVTRLEGDAALLRGEYDELERAENMDKAAGLLRALLDANCAVAKLLLEQDRDGAKKWARGLYINMDTQGGLTAVATPAASEVEAAQAQPATSGELPDELIDAHLLFERHHHDAHVGGKWDRAIALRFYGLGTAIGAGLIAGPHVEAQPAPAREEWLSKTKELVNLLTHSASGAARDRANDALLAHLCSLPQAQPASAPTVQPPYATEAEGDAYTHGWFDGNKADPYGLPRWRHKARGTHYTVLGEAGLQTSNPVSEGCALTIYRGDDDILWARPTFEFKDGRFEQVTNTATQPEAAGEQPVPVGWLESPYGAFRANRAYKLTGPQSVAWSIPVFDHAPSAAPAQARMPLSAAQIERIYHAQRMPPVVVDFARAIEAAHGISGESSGAAPGVQKDDK